METKYLLINVIKPGHTSWFDRSHQELDKLSSKNHAIENWAVQLEHDGFPRLIWNTICILSLKSSHYLGFITLFVKLLNSLFPSKSFSCFVFSLFLLWFIRRSTLSFCDCGCQKIMGLGACNHILDRKYKGFLVLKCQQEETLFFYLPNLNNQFHQYFRN